MLNVIKMILLIILLLFVSFVQFSLIKYHDNVKEYNRERIKRADAENFNFPD